MAKLTRIGRAITPDLRLDPRAALRDTRIRGKLVRTFRSWRSSGLLLQDDIAEDPYADANGRGSAASPPSQMATDAVVLLQVEDWIANDGATSARWMKCAMYSRTERSVSPQRKCRRRRGASRKRCREFRREKAKADVEFVSWRYVMELLERKLSPGQVFGLTIGAAPVSSNGPNGPGPIEKKVFKTVFIAAPVLICTRIARPHATSA